MSKERLIELALQAVEIIDEVNKRREEKVGIPLNEKIIARLTDKTFELLVKMALD